MKLSLKKTLFTLLSSVSLTLGISHSSLAFSFDQVEMDQTSVTAIAQPRRDGYYQLLILEQVPGKRQCWSESGGNPITIDPLLLNFDFTNDCKRATDSNGFSIRMAGTDLGLRYTLTLQKIGNDVLLVGSTSDRTIQPMILGRTRGLSDGFLKIVLEPSWRFTKRAYQGRTLGHYYLTSDQPESTGGVAVSPLPTPSPTLQPTPYPTPSPVSKFRDITTDIYAKEINEAVAMGFVAGFSEDNTFRPQLPLTREQLVSIVLESLKKVPGTNILIPSQISVSNFRDVPASRWSAPKIQFAQSKGIVSGYEDGTFQPNKPVTRAELVTVLRKAAEFALISQRKPAILVAKNTPVTFTDIQGHWAADSISKLSAYCNVASPFNELGNRFYPNDLARRNYAAAATLRMFKCVTSP